jgi:hypothetical protein
MTPRDFAAQLNLDPRLVMIRGRVEPRKKNKGDLQGLTPHYATGGCPKVEYLPNGTALEKTDAAEIEFSLIESRIPLPSAATTYTGKASIVQLVFGGPGTAPNQAAYRVLHEAGLKLSRAMRSEERFLVALPQVKPDKGGICSGRYYFAGLFGLGGDAIYLNPDAIEAKLLTAAWPDDQRERTTRDPVLNAPARDGDSWYEDAVALAKELTSDETRIREAAINARTRMLSARGLPAGEARARAQMDVAHAESRQGTARSLPQDAGMASAVMAQGMEQE